MATPRWGSARLPSFLVRDVGCEPQFFVGLREQIFCSLRVSAKLAVVIALGGIDFLICLDDGDLSGPEVSVAPINVDDRGLRKGNSDAGYDYTDGDGYDQDFIFHFHSPHYLFVFSFNLLLRV
jgi:hypothetical protein